MNWKIHFYLTSTKYTIFWKRYVYDKIYFVKLGSTKFIISVANSFDKDIQFTFEEEKDETIQILIFQLVGKEMI